MPIVRVDDKGKKRLAAKKVAGVVLLGVLAGIAIFYTHDKDVGLMTGLIATAFGSIWSLLDG